MRLARCTECNRTIDLDEIEELDSDKVITCCNTLKGESNG